MGGWWKAPRALVRLLARGELTFNAYALLHLLVESGADRPEGFDTSNGWLVELTGLSDSTTRRALHSLRANGLIEYDDHERVAVFTIRTGDALRSLQGASAVSGAVTGAVSGAVTPSAVSSATEVPRNPASEKEKPAVTPAVTRRTRPRQTETETENHHYVVGDELEKPGSDEPGSSVQRLVARFRALHAELGEPAPHALVGLVAVQVRNLVEDGVSEQTIERALELMLEKELHPSVLPTLVPEAAAGPERRRSIAEQNAEAIRAAAARLEAEEDDEL